MNPLEHNALAQLVSFLVYKTTQCWSSFLKAKFCHYNDDWFLENGGKKNKNSRLLVAKFQKTFKYHHVFVLNYNGVTNNKERCLVFFNFIFCL
jgi:hypothetical protein